MALERLSIAARLGLLLALFAVLGAVLATWALREIHQTRKESARSAEVLTPQLLRITEMELTLTRISLQARHAILARTPEELQGALKDIDKQAVVLNELAGALEAAISTPEGQAQFQDVKNRKAAFWQQAGVVVKHVQEGQKDAAFAHLVDHVVPARDAWLQAMAAQRDFQRQLLLGSMKSSSARVDAAEYALYALLALLTLGSAGCFMLARWMIRARAERAAGVARAIAGGDLTIKVHASRQDEFAPLFVALDSMHTRLVDVVGQVQAGARQVAAASANITQDNADLHLRTQGQASSLQQTVASMDQINATVQNNAQAARQAADLAGTATAVAAKGGEVTAKVVATMDDIAASARRIADIISVIDGIAFQTNILALNAAVEAARAGEQGRGFAVVASEVRALAGRSAEAARQIKDLINTSVDKVEGGTQLVAEAGATMNEIDAQVRRVAGLISEITAATVEQSTGIERISRAVADLDGATQQNAALVQRSADATTSLRDEAQVLVQSVGTFRLAPH